MPPIINGPGALPPGAQISQVDLISKLGCRIGLVLTVPAAQRELLISEGATPADPVAGPALLDTGANNTCIDDQIAKKLGLRQVGIVHVNTPSGDCDQAQYLVEAAIAGNAPALWTVTGAVLAPQGIVALIGTDVLRSCIFTYNGPAGTFALSW